MKTSLSLGVVGGLGLMASPMAVHLGDSKPARVLRYLDRGTVGGGREDARRDWVAHGAKPTSSMDALVGAGEDLDGVFVCAGKNGDDAPLIGRLASLLGQNSKDKFICHMSTVSTNFPTVAAKVCAKSGVQYFSCPLTGGPSGARAGTMLMLASGPEALFDKLLPTFESMGKPKFFGERIDAASEVKLIGHLMVFNGLMGITSAVATHAECFLQGRIGGAEQTEFFDFLNTGGGGTRQWDLFMRPGVKDGTWENGFLIKHATTDAIYAAQLCLDRGLSRLSADAMLNVAFAFSYILNALGDQWATQSIVREFVAAKHTELDSFLEKHSPASLDTRARIKACVASMPDRYRKAVLLDISEKDFR